MTSENLVYPGAGAAQGYRAGMDGQHEAATLADILERVLDKGLVIAGDIRVNLLDIELLTIKLRLVIASVDTARQIGINWWETDPWLHAGGDGGGRRSLEEENRELRARVEALEQGEAPERDQAPKERHD